MVKTAHGQASGLEHECVFAVLALESEPIDLGSGRSRCFGQKLGCTVISQTMATTAAKAGKPQANQSRQRR
jgi:hypothetical protein